MASRDLAAAAAMDVRVGGRGLGGMGADAAAAEEEAERRARLFREDRAGDGRCDVASARLRLRVSIKGLQSPRACPCPAPASALPGRSQTQRPKCMPPSSPASTPARCSLMGKGPQFPAELSVVTVFKQVSRFTARLGHLPP